MIPNKNNNLAVLPFYDSLKEQHHRKPYAFGEAYPLIANKNNLLPFQFRRRHSSSAFPYHVLKKTYTFDLSDPASLYSDLARKTANSSIRLAGYSITFKGGYLGFNAGTLVNEGSGFYIKGACNFIIAIYNYDPSVVVQAGNIDGVFSTISPDYIVGEENDRYTAQYSFASGSWRYITITCSIKDYYTDAAVGGTQYATFNFNESPGQPGNDTSTYPRVYVGDKVPNKTFYSLGATLAFKTEDPDEYYWPAIKGKAIIPGEVYSDIHLRLSGITTLTAVAPPGCEIAQLKISGDTLQPVDLGKGFGVYIPNAIIEKDTIYFNAPSNRIDLEDMPNIRIDKVTVYFAGTSQFNSICFKDLQGSESSNIVNELYLRGLTIEPSKDYDIVTYPAYNAGLSNISFAEGQSYLGYLQLESTHGDKHYSEVVNLVDNTDTYLKIVWWDNEDLFFNAGSILYKSAGFKNILYLDTEIGRPDYKFEEEGDERDGYFFPEKQISKKVYKFTAPIPEYLADAMRLIRLSDNITIEKNGVIYNCDTFLMNVDWLEQGDLAGAEIEFTTDTVVKKIAAGWPK